MLLNLLRPMTQCQTSIFSSFTKFTTPLSKLITASTQQQSRSVKTHRATYKRWRKTATGYKRGIQGRKHGNAGFPARVLGKRTGIAYSTPQQTRHLKKLMPNV
ncbi:unnamed protein product [Ambrosiozyma monospora]|uniref:Unnamed protein product n=1 Tax=Ambrosiozyma monospora TaxID=43982 RepID=A0A9W6Z424_AMBMO|nr:unnamed protein product [Ambrosiozyma monospora]